MLQAETGQCWASEAVSPQRTKPHRFATQCQYFIIRLQTRPRASCAVCRGCNLTNNLDLAAHSFRAAHDETPATYRILANQQQQQLALMVKTADPILRSRRPTSQHVHTCLVSCRLFHITSPRPSVRPSLKSGNDVAYDGGGDDNGAARRARSVVTN